MVNLYIKSIIAETYVYSKVPTYAKAAVKAGLEAKAEAGEITAEKLAEYLSK